MNRKFFLTAGLLALCLLCPASAMTIHDFGKLNDDDAATYMALLVEGAAKNLKAHGQPDQAGKAIAIFHDTGKNGGMNQFVQNLKAINTLNNRNATNPNNRAPVLGVEDAMAQTLSDAGIKVAVKDLKAIGQDFHPVGPPRQKVITPSP